MNDRSFMPRFSAVQVAAKPKRMDPATYDPFSTSSAELVAEMMRGQFRPLMESHEFVDFKGLKSVRFSERDDCPVVHSLDGPVGRLTFGCELV